MASTEKDRKDYAYYSEEGKKSPLLFWTVLVLVFTYHIQEEAPAK